MARITVEDCLKYVANRFELVLRAAQRSRQLEELPVEAMVEAGNHKPTVIALREIAEGKIDQAVLDNIERSIANQANQEEDTEV